MQPASSSSKHVALTALALFVFALLLRLAHIWQIRSAPFFTLMMGDSRAYDDWARRIAAGAGSAATSFIRRRSTPISSPSSTTLSDEIC